VQTLSKQLDQLLLNLAWSLWSELGVAGTKRYHEHCLIFPEELILLTAVLAEIDPRLRDESLDWCYRYHQLISISRLKSIMKPLESTVYKSFSSYAAILNSFARTLWPIFTEVSLLKFTPSQNSRLRSLSSPALFNLRMRSIFSTGARADLITFFLTHTSQDFSASDLTEIGYSKRNLAEILDELCLGGVLNKFLLRNQMRYRLCDNHCFLEGFDPIPKYVPAWRTFLEILLPIRECIKRIHYSSEITQVVEIRNLLIALLKNLHKVNLVPPSLQEDCQQYLVNFELWLLDVAQKIAKGDFYALKPTNTSCVTISFL
jgi:hypothetical protein